jgi:hypothetical protein
MFDLVCFRRLEWEMPKPPEPLSVFNWVKSIQD